MSKPVLFLDSNDIIPLFKSGVPDIETGAKALSQLAQNNELHITSAILEELNGRRVPESYRIPTENISPYVKIHPTPDYVQLVVDSTGDAGERSIAAVMDPNYVDPTLGKTKYHDPSLPPLDDTKNLQFVSDENKVPPSLEKNRIKTINLIENGLAEGSLQEDTYKKISQNNRGKINQTPIDPPEKVIAKKIQNAGGDAHVDDAGKLHVNGKPTTVSEQLANKVPQAANVVDNAKTGGRHLDTDDLSKLAEYGKGGAAKILKAAVPAGLSALGVILTVAEASDKANKGDYQGAGETIIGGIAGGLSGYVAAAGGMALAAAVIGTVGLPALVGVALAGAAAGTLGFVGGQEAAKQLMQSLEGLGLVPPGYTEQLGKDLDFLLDNPWDVLDELLPPWLGGPPDAPEGTPPGGALGPLDGTPPTSAPLSGGIGPGGFDPLVLDINGDGRIALKSVADGVYYDFHADGFAEKSAWISAEDGVLVWDRDRDGLIEGYAEMIASPVSLNDAINDWENFRDDIHGFAQLSALDANQDGVFDAKDAMYRHLRVWQDANQDGISQADELKTLAQLKIKSIDIAGARLDNWNGVLGGGFTRQIEGNTITHSSTFTLTNGTKREIVDAWLDHEMENARYMGDYMLDPRVLFLPTLRGYGSLPALHIAMSKDESLLTMVETFTAKRTFAQMFSDHAGLRAEVEAILYKWAGVNPAATPTQLQIAEGGVFEFMPEYKFLKKLTGLDGKFSGPWFAEWDGLPITFEGIEAVNRSFDAVVENLAMRLMYQSGANTLFASGGGYDPLSDVFTGVMRLSQTAITQLQTAAVTVSDKELFWHNVVVLLDASIGIPNLNATERGWLNTAIVNSTGNVFNWNKIVVNLDADMDRVNVTSTAPKNGTRWDDELVAWGVNGVKLYGLDGNDRLNGSGGADWLEGGKGDDYLQGNGGSDTFVYESGHDVIDAHSFNYPTDVTTVQFAAGIRASDVSLTIARPNDFFTRQIVLTVKGRGTINIETNAWDANPYHTFLDNLKFADGSTVKFADLAATTLGTENNDEISAQTGNNVSSIYGLGGNDTIHGDPGIKNEKFYGGVGDDIIYGYRGNDTYVYESGHDLYEEYAGQGNDTILFAGSIKLSDISIERDFKELFGDEINARIVIKNKGSIFLPGQFYGNYVENLKFSDGTTINIVNIWKSHIVNGTNAGQTLLGLDSSPYFLQDYLYGKGGNDILNGGAGNDILYGGLGNDKYIVGNGFDSIYEDEGGTDTIEFNSSYDLTKFAFKPAISNEYLDVLYDGVQKVRLMGQFSSGNWGVETLTVIGKGSINLPSLVYDQIGDDAANIINGISTYGSLNNRIFGMAGNDTLNAQNGNDFLEGGKGNDQLKGGLGDDIYNYLGTGDEGVDRIFEDGGNDTIKIGGTYTASQVSLAHDADTQNLKVRLNGSDFLIIESHLSNAAAQKVEKIQFGDGSVIDLFPYRNLYGTEGGNTLNGLDLALLKDDYIYGNGGNDKLYGHAGNDWLWGGSANDILEGGAGDDRLEGEDGNDQYVYTKGAGMDTINDYQGSADSILIKGYTKEEISLSVTETHNLLIKAGAQVLMKVESQFGGYDAIESIRFEDGSALNPFSYRYTFIGTNGNDNITGIDSKGGNIIRGLDGSDLLYGDQYIDIIYGGTGADNIEGYGGNDMLYGDADFDQLLGGDGNDKIYGGSGDDYLEGGNGNDIFYGDDGVDTLYGGDGADTFMFMKATAYNGIDDILDFKLADNDRINIKDLLIGYDPLTKAITDFVRITSDGSSSILKVDADGGANKFVQIAMLYNTTGLTNEQALVNSGHLVVV